MNSNNYITKEACNDCEESNKVNSSIFNKINLIKAVEFMKDLKFEDDEINKIYEKAKDIINQEQFSQIFNQIGQENEESKEIEEILKGFSDNIEPDSYLNLIHILAKNEEFLAFVQDLLLDKLL